MPIPKTLEFHLKKNKVAYEVVPHRTVFTAYDLASTLREKLESIGKTLLIWADKELVLVLLPASRRLDLAKLKKFLAAKKISIASEKEMIAALKVKAGALTPFGSLHKVPVVVDRALARTTTVLLGAGSFTESLRLKMKDYLKTEHPREGAFSTGSVPTPISVKVAAKRAAKRPKRRPAKKTSPKKKVSKKRKTKSKTARRR